MMNYTPLSRVTTVLFVVALVVLLAILPATAGTISSSDIGKTAGSSTVGAGSASGHATYSLGDENLIYESGVEVDQIGKGTTTASVPTTILDPSPVVAVNVLITDLTATGTVTGRDTTISTGEANAGSNVTVRSGYTPDGDIVNLTGVSVSAEISSFADAFTGTKGTSATASSSASAVVTAEADVANPITENFALDLDIDGSTDAYASVTKKNSDAYAWSDIYADAGTCNVTESDIERYADAGMGSYSEVSLGTGSANAMADGTATAYSRYDSETSFAYPWAFENSASVDGEVSTDVTAQNVGAGATTWSQAWMDASSHADTFFFMESITDFDAYAGSYAYGSSSKYVGSADAESEGTGGAATTYSDTNPQSYNQGAGAESFDLSTSVYGVKGTGETEAYTGIDATAAAGSSEEFYLIPLEVYAEAHTDTDAWAETEADGWGSSYTGTALATNEATPEASISLVYGLADDEFYNAWSISSTTLTTNDDLDYYMDSYSTAKKQAWAWDEADSASFSAYGVEGALFGDGMIPTGYPENVTFNSVFLSLTESSNMADAESYSGSASAFADGLVDGAGYAGGLGTALWFEGTYYPYYDAESNVQALGVIYTNATATKTGSYSDSIAGFGALQATDMAAEGNTELNTYPLTDDSQLAATGSFAHAEGFGANEKASALAELSPSDGGASGLKAWGESTYVDDPEDIAELDNQRVTSATVGSFEADVSNVNAGSMGNAGAGSFALTGVYLEDFVDPDYLSVSGSGMITESDGESISGSGKASASSSVSDLSTFGSGFFEAYDEEGILDVDPNMHSYSLISDDAKDSITIAGGKSSSPYTAEAFNFAYGIDVAAFDGENGAVAWGDTALASEVATNGPVLAHAETNWVDLNNLATVSTLDPENSVAMEENYFTNAKTYADVNAKAKVPTANTIAGWGTVSQTATGFEPALNKEIRFGDQTEDTFFASKIHSWAFATIEGTSSSDENVIYPDLHDLVFIDI